MRYLILLLTLCSFIIPPKTYNGYKTDYAWYNNKYEDFWELTDSCIVNRDTMYLYKLGGQHFIFNQKGERL